MLKCFENIIGIKSECNNNTKPKSGLYIEALPGIKLNSTAAIASGDRTGVELMKDSIENAINAVKEELGVYVTPNFRINTVVDSLKAGVFSSNYHTFAPFERGMRIQKTKSTLTSIVIRSVIIRSNTTAPNQTLKITDGIVTYTQSVDLLAGVDVEVIIDYTCVSDNVFITLDNTALAMNKTSFEETVSGCGCSSSKNVRRDTFSLKFTGWNGAGNDSSSYGIQAEVQLTCNQDYIFCNVLPALHSVIFYKAGLLLCQEWLISPRLNQYTMLNREQITVLQESWEKSYDKRFKLAANSLKDYLSKLDDTCVICTQKRYREGL